MKEAESARGEGGKEIENKKSERKRNSIRERDRKQDCEQDQSPNWKATGTPQKGPWHYESGDLTFWPNKPINIPPSMQSYDPINSPRKTPVSSTSRSAEHSSALEPWTKENGNVATWTLSQREWERRHFVQLINNSPVTFIITRNVRSV